MPAPKITAMTACDGTLYATTNDERLIYRDAVLTGAKWRSAGRAPQSATSDPAFEVVGLAASRYGELYAATNDYRLWYRYATSTTSPWRHIGHALFLRAMTGVGGYLYGATHDNFLWKRKMTTSDVWWQEIHHAYNVVAMAANCDG